MRGNERRESVESTRYGLASRRIARNRLISFANGDEKLARSYSYPSQVFPPWVAKYPVLSVARGNARTGAKKNLES